MPGINQICSISSSHAPAIEANSQSEKKGTFKGWNVTAQHGGIMKFMAATFRGIEQKILSKALCERKVKQTSTEPLRHSMRDARDNISEAIENGDMRNVRLHGQELCKNSLTALKAGDQPLCNGGVLTLGELGAKLISKGETQTARQVAFEIMEMGKKALSVKERGTAVTANVALRIMRSKAQEQNETKLADKLLRNQLEIVNEHGAGIAQALIDDGIKAINNGDYPQLKLDLNEGLAIARSANKKDFPESLQTCAKSYESLAKHALEKGDEPLANTIILKLKDLSAETARRNDTKGLITIALTMNRISAEATEKGLEHTPVLVKRLHSQIMDDAQKTTGGTAQYLAEFPMETPELLEAADETYKEAASAIRTGDQQQAIELISSLGQIANSLVLRGESKNVPSITSKLVQLGNQAGEKSHLAVLDHITDALSATSETCSHAGNQALATKIAAQQLQFPSAWELALKHKGTETENIVHIPPSFHV